MLLKLSNFKLELIIRNKSKLSKHSIHKIKINILKVKNSAATNSYMYLHYNTKSSSFLGSLITRELARNLIWFPHTGFRSDDSGFRGNGTFGGVDTRFSLTFGVGGVTAGESTGSECNLALWDGKWFMSFICCAQVSTVTSVPLVVDNNYV